MQNQDELKELREALSMEQVVEAANSLDSNDGFISYSGISYSGYDVAEVANIFTQALDGVSPVLKNKEVFIQVLAREAFPTLKEYFAAYADLACEEKDILFDHNQSLITDIEDLNEQLNECHEGLKQFKEDQADLESQLAPYVQETWVKHSTAQLIEAKLEESERALEKALEGNSTLYETCLIKDEQVSRLISILDRTLTRE